MCSSSSFLLDRTTLLHASCCSSRQTKTTRNCLRSPPSSPPPPALPPGPHHPHGRGRRARPDHVPVALGLGRVRPMLQHLPSQLPPAARRTVARRPEATGRGELRSDPGQRPCRPSPLVPLSKRHVPARTPRAGSRQAPDPIPCGSVAAGSRCCGCTSTGLAALHQLRQALPPDRSGRTSCTP